MSKIAEQKALEAYPIESHEFHDDFWKERNCYVKGYDQAMQDFLEKACEWLNENQDIYFGTSCIYRKELFEDFKNYMQNESEK